MCKSSVGAASTKSHWSDVSAQALYSRNCHGSEKYDEEKSGASHIQINIFLIFENRQRRFKNQRNRFQIVDFLFDFWIRNLTLIEKIRIDRCPESRSEFNQRIRRRTRIRQNQRIEMIICGHRWRRRKSGEMNVWNKRKTFVALSRINEKSMWQLKNTHSIHPKQSDYRGEGRKNKIDVSFLFFDSSSLLGMWMKSFLFSLLMPIETIFSTEHNLCWIVNDISL